MVSSNANFELDVSFAEEGFGTASAGATLPGRRRPIWQKILLSLCIAMAAAGIVAGIGAAYETIAASGDADAYPMPGRLVGVGEYRLHLHCEGEGGPTVVMDAGLGKSSLDWLLVQPELAQSVRTCAFDRAGMGWSDAGPEPRSPGQLGRELHALLKNAGESGPYVLVGHSLAGKNLRMFAAAYPEDVAGMVLIDARSEVVEALSDQQGFASAIEAQGALYATARRFGIARAFGADLAGVPGLSRSDSTQIVLVETTASAILETTLEGKSRTADDDALAATDLGDLPLVILASAQSMENIPGWPEGQDQMTQLSSRGHFEVVNNAGHAIHLDRPQAVIEAVADVIAQVHASKP